MVISIYAEKVFYKIQHPFMKKSSPESGDSIILPIYDKYSKSHSKWGKTESIVSMIRNKTRMLTLVTIIQHSLGSPGHGNHESKHNKMNQIGKEELKLSQVADDIISWIEDSREATRANQ